MTSPLASRLPFLIGAALVAAALADPLVESVSNAGVFGRGYDDNNHLGVVPTLTIGLVLVLAIASLRCHDVWRKTTKGSGDWLADVARDVATRSHLHDIVFVFPLQLLALFTLESSEQLLSGNAVVGGTAWLGGPILFSLCTHAMLGALCTFALSWFMRAIAQRFASFVQKALRFVWLAIARATGGTSHVGARRSTSPRTAAPRARQIGGRAPPLLPRPA